MATKRLSLSMNNTNIITNVNEVRCIFSNGLTKIRDWEEKCRSGEVDFVINKKEIDATVRQILKSIG